jgi:hypothetical protein
MVKRGFRRIDEQIDKDTHQIRHYSKRFVRRVRYTLKPCEEEELEMLKALFPQFLEEVGFKKLIPKAIVKEDSIIYQCEGKPDIYFDVRKGTIHIPTEDYHKYEKATQQNQAHFLVENIKKCSNAYEIDYMEIHYLKRHLRYGKTVEPFENPYSFGENTDTDSKNNN